MKIGSMAKIVALLLALTFILPVAFACKKNENKGNEDTESVSDVVDTNGDTANTSDVTEDTAEESESEETDDTAESEVEDTEDATEESAEETEDTDEDTEAETDEDIRYDANGFQMDNLPEDMNFNGKEVRIFAHPQVYNEFEIAIEEINASVLNNAVYRRNLKTEARTKARLVFVMEQVSNELNYTKQLENIQLSGTDACSLFAAYSRDSSGLMIKGYTADLNRMDYLDFSAPWWSQGLVEKASIYNHLYFCSGDISPMLFGQTFVIFYNKVMAEEYINPADYGVESLYDMVYNKTWTLDNMIAMCKGVGNNFDTKDANDTFGFAVNLINQDGMYQAAGLNVLDYNDDGSVKVSDDMSSAKAVTLVQKLVEFYDTQDAMCNTEYSDGSEKVPGAAWNNGNVMFFMDIVKHATDHQKKGLEFGLLPIPKWDVDQENYYSISGFPFSMWSMARLSETEDSDAAAAVLECLASESHRTVAPALYTTVLQEQASNSSQDYEMWNTIKASVTIEGGRCFDANLEMLGWTIFREAVKSRGDYMSVYGRYADKLAGNVASMNTIISTLEEIYGG